MGREGGGWPAPPGDGNGFWGELSVLVEYFEEESSRVEGRPARPALEVWGEIEQGQPAGLPEPGRAGRTARTTDPARSG
jgi:hypothetical protein